MNVILRLWKIKDAGQLAQMANNISIARYMADVFPSPYTLHHAKEFIEKANANGPSVFFAIEYDGKPVGGIGLHRQADILCKNYEIGYWLSEAYWRKGIATYAIKQMVDYGFQNLDVIRIFARIFGNNIASQKAILKADFILEGKYKKTIFKNGEFLDELIYAIRKKI